ncbi:MAG: helix-hairpin-helix domain-containing protein [Gammaproteobacteria bacterium]
MKSIKSLVLLLGILLSVNAFAGPVDINAADAVTLADVIDGIGEKKAGSIVQYRELHGPFASVDDLVNVKGIGLKIIERNRANLTVAKPGS